MRDSLYSIDRAVFEFINITLANPLFDGLMPPLTDWNKSWIGLGIVGGLWLWLMLGGGRKGWMVGSMLILLVIFTDQFSSHFLKPIFSRPRPCHSMAVHVRLLVDCGSGFSFPSSHAVNNTALAVLMSYYYRRWTWTFALYASLMCLSRVVVGVHYPSDVLGGAIIGGVCAFMIIYIQRFLGSKFAAFGIPLASIKTNSGDDGD
jgi:undecaprenyl-diphosphatase